MRLPDREPRDNARFVITNLPIEPQQLYEDIYCQRAHIELRIKELHHGLEIDRTSCTRFWANQLRVLLTAAAYVLMQELRTRATGTACARAQVSTLRERLLKLGVWVSCSVRRILRSIRGGGTRRTLALRWMRGSIRPTSASPRCGWPATAATARRWRSPN